MKLNSKISKEIENNNKIITTNQILQLGFSKTLISNYVKNGLLEKISHGIYALPNTIIDDMYLLMLRSSKIVFSHDSALFLHGLSDRTPFRHSITLPSDSSIPKDMKDECNCFYITPELFELGIVQIKTTFGNMVKSYNMERTVCDFLRSRNRCDEKMVINAIKNYASSSSKNLNLLAIYSEQLKVGKELKKYLEVLL